MRAGSEHRGVVVHLERLKGDRVNLACVIEREDVAELVRFLVRNTASDGRLFPFTPRTMLNVLKRSCKSLGLSDRYVCHSLRHGGATSMLQRGYTVTDIMVRGRWESVKTASRYIQAGHGLLLKSVVPRRVAELGAAAAERVYDAVIVAAARGAQ